MTLKEAALKAVQTNNIPLFSRVIDQLRDSGNSYNDCQAFFKKCAGLEPDDFENMSQEADDFDSKQ